MWPYKGGRCGMAKCLLSLFILTASKTASSYTVVTTSTATPKGTEEALIAQTTTQFNATLFVNPLFPGTYQIKLLGPNSNYNPPPTVKELFNAAVLMSTETYIYGWADGMSYERHNNVGKVGSYVTQVSTSDPACVDILGELANDIYSQSFSTPTVVPPEAQ